MTAIDVFAHILPPNFYASMLQVDPAIPQKAPYTQVPALLDINLRRTYMAEYPQIRQVLSVINLNPEDFTDPVRSYEICWAANEELVQTVRDNPDLFEGAVAMLPMNNIEGAERIMRQQVAVHPELFGAQIFSKALGISIADPQYRTVFAAAHHLGVGLWLHPVFDPAKHDNNLVFSWEYEQSQAMLEIIMADIFTTYPGITIITHHAGAMVPFFANRLPLVMDKNHYGQFKNFFVDTAIIGNTQAVEMAISYFGSDRVLFGTDAPVGVKPAGPTAKVLASIENARVPADTRQKIYSGNWKKLLTGTGGNPHE